MSVVITWYLFAQARALANWRSEKHAQAFLARFWNATPAWPRWPISSAGPRHQTTRSRISPTTWSSRPPRQEFRTRPGDSAWSSRVRKTNSSPRALRRAINQDTRAPGIQVTPCWRRSTRVLGALRRPVRHGMGHINTAWSNIGRCSAASGSRLDRSRRSTAALVVSHALIMYPHWALAVVREGPRPDGCLPLRTSSTAPSRLSMLSVSTARGFAPRNLSPSCPPGGAQCTSQPASTTAEGAPSTAHPRARGGRVMAFGGLTNDRRAMATTRRST